MVLSKKKIVPFLVKMVIVLMLLFPLGLTAQKFKVSEYDKTTRQWKIETFPVNVKSSSTAKMDVAIRVVDTLFSIRLMGSGVGTNTVDVNNQVVFLLDSDSVVIARSPFIQSSDYDKAIP